jgi:hypothetical protein
LLESEKTTDNLDLQKLSVGSLPPKGQVKIIISVVYELETADSTEEQESIFLGLPEILFPNSKFDFSANITIQSPNGIKDVELSKHLDKIAKLEEVNKNETLLKVEKVEYGNNSSAHATIELSKPFEPNALVEYNPSTKSMAMMFSFKPSWKLLDEDLIVSYSEIIFLVDR